MARLEFEVQAVRDRDGDLATGVAYQIYTDEAATSLADISATSGGSAIAGSTVVVADIAGLGPSALRWWGPPSGTDELYLKTASDPTLPVQKVEAVTDQRLDALEAALGGTTPSQFARRDQANTFTASNTFDADAYFKSGRPWADVRAWGATGDGSTNDQPAIQAAIDAVAATEASGAVGGIVFVPKGVYVVQSQVVVKNKVRLFGVDRSASVIKAGGSFPVSTPVVRLGDGTSIVFGCRLEHLTVDANSVAGSVGVYSNEIQEESGVFWSLIQRAAAVGIDYATGCQNCGVADSEIIPTAGASAGLRTNITGQAFAERLTIAEYSGAGSITAGIEGLGNNLTCRNIHVERATNGIYYKGATTGVVESLVGHSSVTNLFRADVSSNSYVLLDVMKNGSTNAILDDYMGTGAITSDFVRFYCPHEIRLADVLLRGLGAVLTLTGELKITSNVGFYGATPAAKPTITGSRAGNAALADLLTELATLGLITDSSSA